MYMKNTLIVLVVVVLVGVGAYMFWPGPSTVVAPVQNAVDTTTTDVIKPVVQVNKAETIIGQSVEKRDIVAYHFGTGSDELLFIGGIHGGYEWNTALVAYKLVDYLKTNPGIIPANVKVTVIPVLNPDGLRQVVGTTTGNFTSANVSSNAANVESGRFNANNVDLNRNFDCDWQASGKWKSMTVSGGSSAFSEPESRAIKSYVEAHKPTAVVVWYSSAGGVFASSCHNGVSKETNAITKKFADVSGYPAYQSFDFYEITGDMVNWFAKNDIPAISVLLTNHNDIEWNKNQAGVDVLLKYYTK